jgi:gamma-glutamyltranspeptidase/glutathione hydrolase
MIMRRFSIVATLAGFALLTSPVFAEKVARGEQGAAATEHPLASKVAIDVLKSGGNAVDAAVAVGLMLGVVAPHHSGIGGGCFLLIRRPDGAIFALDARETAPAAATRDMFLRDGKLDPLLSQRGALAVATPGALAGYALAAKTHGRKPLRELIAPAIEAAENGFAIHGDFAELLNNHREIFPELAGAAAIHGGTIAARWKAGDLFPQIHLAASYRSIADQGTDWFYRGAFAEKLDAAMREAGGRVVASDLAGYEVISREPLRGSYRGVEIVSFPPPSSGGIHVLQILRLVERFDLAKASEGERAHLLGEAMKIAFADRAHWLGDPDFARVPRGLLDADYLGELSAKIAPDRLLGVDRAGQPPVAGIDVFEKKHTTHFSVADAEGWWVACTATINTTFGSGFVVPGTGIVLNNEMDDFAIQPGVPNYFGLIGAEANAVEPRKRPLSSMTPTLVLRDGQPILALGAAGGPTIITQTVGNLVGVLDLELPLDSALAAPRVHHQWRPDELRIETAWSEAAQGHLTQLGHRLKINGKIGVSNAVGREGTGFIGVSEPRQNTGAAAW